ncbi:threonylcarbamoyl-AMP synthase [Flavobacteriaceae bacterium Ap0902]|nr:threonylcarbamoyl-AMP synthase [Flavobacteriaceae bacterium Ap0902]
MNYSKTYHNMQKAIDILQNSGVILTPTDTTFGLSCIATDQKAILKINQIKNRPENKNFILLVDSDRHLEKLVDVPELAWDIIDLSDKPLTIIYDKIIDIPDFLISPAGTIGIRIVDYLPLKKIIQRVKTPLISTSANLSGEKPPRTFNQINPQLLEKVDYIMPETETFAPPFEASSIIEIKHDGQIKVIRA